MSVSSDQAGLVERKLDLDGDYLTPYSIFSQGPDDYISRHKSG